MKDTKDFLKQLKKLDLMIKNKLIEKEQWKSIAFGTTAHSDGERVQSSGSKQKMADAVDRYIDIEAEIDQCIDRLVDAKKDVISVIEQLNPTQYDIIHKIYVQFCTFEEVANAYDKSKGWVATVHGRALKNVKNILEERAMHGKKGSEIGLGRPEQVGATSECNNCSGGE